jgi:hypothetical protein
MGAPVTSIAVSGDGAVHTTHGTYRGFTLRETSGGAAAVVVLYDHASAASGTIIEQISLAQGESARELYPDGVRVSNGIYVDVVSGAVAGSIRIG